MQHFCVGIPQSSAGKKSTRNARNPSSIPGSGRSPGEGNCYPRQYSWSSLVAQLVKNLHAMQESWVWSLGWEDPLEKGTATHSKILAWRIPWTIQSIEFFRPEYWSGFPLPQGIFPTQGLNPGLPHCRRILYQLSHKGRCVYTHTRLYAHCYTKISW